MDLEDFITAVEIRLVHKHLSVEAARSEKGRIKDFGPVGRSQYDDTASGIEAVPG